jgi:aromatic-amino-acid transaminase
MFAEIKPSTPDPIMSLMEAYLQDRNPRKVNLSAYIMTSEEKYR